MSKDDLQMLLFDLGFEQTEDGYLEFERDRTTIDIDEDNSIGIYYCDNVILKLYDIDNEIIAKIINGIS